MNTKDLLKAANEFGTPLYVYDGTKIIQQYKRLKNAFPGLDVKLNYAMKALSNSHVLRLLKNEGSGCDAVSIEEVHLALRAGFLPHDVLFTPNCVGFEEIQEAVKLGVRINIDNLSILEEFGAYYKNEVPCCIRVNPHIMAGGNSHISVGHIDSKFGISIYQMKHVLRIVKNYNIHVDGLHMHTGSDILDSGAFLRGAELLYDAAYDFPDLEFLDFGSGFKVAYKEGDIVTNIESIGKEIAESFQQFCKNYGKELELWFEPGKFLVSEAGVLLVKANVVKQTTSTVFVGVNSGQNHLIRPMFYDSYHHIVNISNESANQKLYSVVGYICESDTLGYDRMIAEVRIGDILSIQNAGAYGFSMSNNYNSRLRPAEVLISGKDMKLIRRRETIEDVIRNEVVENEVVS
jgi:diaminopimelate decarboxylase